MRQAAGDDVGADLDDGPADQINRSPCAVRESLGAEEYCGADDGGYETTAFESAYVAILRSRNVLNKPLGSTYKLAITNTPTNASRLTTGIFRCQIVGIGSAIMAKSSTAPGTACAWKNF